MGGSRTPPLRNRTIRSKMTLKKQNDVTDMAASKIPYASSTCGALWWRYEDSSEAHRLKPVPQIAAYAAQPLRSSGQALEGKVCASRGTTEEINKQSRALARLCLFLD